MIGRTLSHYEILEEISRGGMGIVYRAHDVKLHRDVALKILPPELVEDEERKRRFVQEARAAAALQHPNIATVFEIGEADDTTFIAMELIEGEQLSDVLSRGPLSLERSVQVAQEIADGLARAHDKGVVHRDLKPSNVMIAPDGHAKLIDFGVAKLVEVFDEDGSEAATAIKETRPGSVLGTVAYMSPEQAKGSSVDHRSDVFSFGIVLHEMLSGHSPFDRDTGAETLAAILNESAPKLTGNAGKLQSIVNRCLAKDPDSRYEAMEDVALALRAESASTPATRIWKKALVGLALASTVAGWFLYQNLTQVRWAREVAVPEVARLMEEDNYVEAFALASEAERHISGDPTLVELWSRLSRRVSFDTDPVGAEVWYRPYGRPEQSWELLGVTPIVERRVPFSPFWIKVEKEGYYPNEELVPLFLNDRQREFHLDLDVIGSVPPEMARVPGGRLRIYFAGFDPAATFDAPSFHIDEREVTNEDFQRFVDAGGYRTEDYWKHPFMKEGVVLSWDEAMARFRDETGRHGPSTWAGGTYPDERSEHPVSGVSWYEAAAYAEFVGKSLPTVYHWLWAGRSWGAEYVLPLSNFDGDGPRPVASQPPSFFGAYDMAGNVKEWCWNASGSDRYILGGGWDEPPHMFYEPDFRDPFDRSPTNGFRLALYHEPLENELAAMLEPIERPLGSRADEEPVSDATFDAYKAQFYYDPAPLNAVTEAVDDTAQHWRQETISLDAAYGGERLLVHLFLPKNVDPPYQGIVFYPGSGANSHGSSDQIDFGRLDFVIMSGRAVVYPVYKGTYERNDGVLRFTDAVPTRQYTDYVVWWIKDMMRALDYVESRDDFDADKLGYLGFSWGARLGNIALAVDDRLKVGILLSGGLNAQAPRPEVSETHYATRVRVPVLMLGGSRDVVFPLETSQNLMFSLLGTPDEHKKHVVFDAGHAVLARYRGRAFKEMLDWLDRYLGPIE